MHEKESAFFSFWEAVHKGHITHFYLFYGEKKHHKEKALALAATLNCLKKDQILPVRGSDEMGPLFCGECSACRKIFSGCHPDVEVISPAKTSIGIDQVTALQKKASRKPYEGLYHVYIIEEAEKLTIPAGNALLVTAEEPSAQTILILSCASDANILPTLRSRARAVYFPPDHGLCQSGNNAALAQAIERIGPELIRDLSYGYEEAVNAGDFLRLFTLFPLEREIAIIWLQTLAADIVTGLRRETVPQQGNAMMVLPWIEEALRALQRQADIRLTIEVLALKHMRGLNLWRK